MIEVRKYQDQDRKLWDDFVRRSKNGVFLFFRDYMEYHSDRFQDHSLIFSDGNKILALLPANIENSTLVSHRGLTFGGMITSRKMKTSTMLKIFKSLKEYFELNKLKDLLYKSIPHIYHIYPAEEDLYALFINNASLVRRDVSSTIELNHKLPYGRGRKRNVRMGEKTGLVFKESDDYQNFMALKEEKLIKKYGVKPTHTAAEMEYLSVKFPENIKLFVVENKGQIIHGLVMYESANVAHAQYQEATAEGQKLRVPDLVLDRLINHYYKDKKYFDFGVSTENNGLYLNQGLIDYKETFGGRAVVYDTYRVEFGG
ncbi:MAG: GNAT family N-acetyltransferase [Methanobacterium sp.]|nr:GNAT family N-acetyltransferase [Methanobacterium sp.]